jgi:signal transduction histidine kinase
MTDNKKINPGESDYRSMRTVRQSMKVIFSCLTAIPFFVFAFIFTNIGGSFNTALTGALITLALVLVLEGFIVFRKMAEHIERLSSDMVNVETGSFEKIKKEGGDTRELAVIADTFNRTLDKLEDTATQLSAKVAQVSTLNEIGEAVSKTINIDKIAALILEKSINGSSSRAGYMAIRQGESPAFQISAVTGIGRNIEGNINPDAEKSLAGRAIEKKSPIRIEDIELDASMKALNIPDLGRPRLLYLPIMVKETAIGLLALGRDINQKPYEEEEILFLQTLLRHAGAGMENARLYKDLQTSNQKLEESLITQKKTQAHLLTSARMTAFGELSVNVAHELNNPLTGIMGYADLMLSSSMDEDEKISHLEEIKNQAGRAGNIIRSLLDFADSSSGSWTDLNSLIQKTLLLVKGRLHDLKTSLDLHLEEGLPLIEVDRNEMKQVFLNLINNAVNAMSGIYKSYLEEDATIIKQRCLKIVTEKKGDKICISFQDNGSGIYPEDLPRIFEPFFSTKKEVSQVGLGLWVSHRIIRANGGTIKVRSKLGEGSAFFVILPTKGLTIGD